MKIINDVIRKLREKQTPWTEIDRILDLPPDGARNKARGQEWYKEIAQSNPHDKASYVDKKSYRDDGSISSFIRTRLDEKKTFSKNELLELHGLDPDEFKIKNITSNEWSMTNGSGDKFYNFQSKILAEPVSDIDRLPEMITEAIQQYAKPFDIDVMDDDKLIGTLLINLPDLHIGSNTAEEYSVYQDGILIQLENQYENVVISLLGDLFNANSFQSKTIHDTRVSDTDIPQSWDEAVLFIEPIIQKALSTSPNVTVVYSRGNHDETITWAFTKYLEAKYPQVEFDVSTKQLKCVQIDRNAIYLTHGHIRKRNLAQLCATLYPQEWAKSENRLLLTGHFHTIKTEDLTGVVHYQLPTVGKSTDYEEENMFLGSQRGVHLFELGYDRVNAIYYL
ncbi:metallophosphoesterase [Jeotgalibaca porci]|uniref:metallophosphoesterase n=2 Tax=Jeotgalibaca porci TaxID=1868793 RepID=UPI0035A0DBA2